MTQKEMVLHHLNQHGEITAWEAIQAYGITRLAAWICELRKDGVEIVTENVVKKKGERTISYAKYKIVR